MDSLTIKRFFVAGTLLVLIPTFVWAAPAVFDAVPHMINYQGRLTDDAGAPINGNRPVVFSLYSTASGGGVMWTEGQTVTFTDGAFSVELGSVTAVPDAVFFTTSVYLGVAVDTDAEMAPRQRLMSVGYAYRADSAKYADNATNATNAVNASHAADADTLGGQSASEIISTASAGGVPSGFMILGTAETPPQGYTYTGLQVENVEHWTTKTPMHTARYGLAAAVVNDRIYAIGGSNGSYIAVNEEYDPATNTWTTKAPMLTPRSGLATVAVNGKIYAIGGINGSYLYVNEEYDPITDTWITKAPMLTYRAFLAAAAVNGKIYAMGGSGGSYLTTNEEYDPATDVWTTKTPMLIARSGLAAAVVNGKIYAIGGYSFNSGNIYYTANQEYDPTANTWTSKSPMPTARRYLAATAVGGRIYAMGGDNGSSLLNNESYDPATDTWTTRCSMRDARTLIAAAAVNGRVYTIGGANGPGIFEKTEEYTAPSYYYMHVKD